MFTKVTDPVEAAQMAASHDQFMKNVKWLHSHWSNVLPQGMGKYIAVAGEEPFIADSRDEAERMAREAHPEDQGVYVHRPRPETGPRFYGFRWHMGDVLERQEPTDDRG